MASHTTGDGKIPPRDAAQRGLKRVMSLGGAYGTRNYTVKDLRDLKGKRVLTETVPFSVEEAAAAEAAAREARWRGGRSVAIGSALGAPVTAPLRTSGGGPGSAGGQKRG